MEPLPRMQIECIIVQAAVTLTLYNDNIMHQHSTTFTVQSTPTLPAEQPARTHNHSWRTSIGMWHIMCPMRGMCWLAWKLIRYHNEIHLWRIECDPGNLKVGLDTIIM